MEKAKFMQMVDNDTTRRLPIEKGILRWDATRKYDNNVPFNQDTLDWVTLFNNVFKPENELKIPDGLYKDLTPSLPYITEGKHLRPDDETLHEPYYKMVADAHEIFNQIQTRNNGKNFIEHMFTSDDVVNIFDDIIWTRGAIDNVLTWHGFYQSPEDNIHIYITLTQEYNRDTGIMEQSFSIHGTYPTYIVQQYVFPYLILLFTNTIEWKKHKHHDDLIGKFIIDDMTYIRDLLPPPQMGNLSMYNDYIFNQSKNSLILYYALKKRLSEKQNSLDKAQERAKEKEKENV